MGNLRRQSLQFVAGFFDLRRDAREYASRREQITARLNDLMQKLYYAVGVKLNVEETHPRRQLATVATIETNPEVQPVGASQIPQQQQSGAATAFVVVCTAASLLF